MASWSRQTYYAGLAPSGGLSFPAEAACYPIAMNAQTEDRRRSDRRLMWDDQQRLRGGYLTSRSSSQFMVAWAGRGSQGLDLSEAGGAAPGVRNRLGSLIERLVVRDSAGRYFLGASLEPGGQATLEPADAATAAGILKRLFNDNRLAFPPGYDPQYYNNSFAFRPRYYGWSDVDQQEPPPKFELGLLERSLDRALFQGAGQLPPRSYVAVLRTSPEVPIGYRAAREEAGFHVLQGRW
jgi:hypothetical protein